MCKNKSIKKEGIEIVIKFSEQFQELINFDIPREMLSSVKCGHIEDELKYAENGFIEKYCMEY